MLNDFLDPIFKEFYTYKNELIQIRQEERNTLVRKLYLGAVEGLDVEN